MLGVDAKRECSLPSKAIVKCPPHGSAAKIPDYYDWTSFRGPRFGRRGLRIIVPCHLGKFWCACGAAFSFSAWNKRFLSHKVLVRICIFSCNFDLDWVERYRYFRPPTGSQKGIREEAELRSCISEEMPVGACLQFGSFMAIIESPRTQKCVSRWRTLNVVKRPSGRLRMAIHYHSLPTWWTQSQRYGRWRRRAWNVDFLSSTQKKDHKDHYFFQGFCETFSPDYFRQLNWTFSQVLNSQKRTGKIWWIP